MVKKTLVLLFGGQSSEHEVSCMSALNVAGQVDPEQYSLLLVGITQEGHWLKVNSLDEIRSGEWRSSGVEAALSPDAVKKCLLVAEGGEIKEIPVDVVFPVLHGLYGEDGTVQGLLELAKIPYVGCGVLSSAVSMDKLCTKVIAGALGIRQAAYLPIMRWQLETQREAFIAEAEEKLGYPMFVKPSNSGSSRGISKAKDREGLIRGLEEAARHDRRILVEEAINGHEIECAVLGGGSEPVRVSGLGEIFAAGEFYDYESKYFDSNSRTTVNPRLPRGAEEGVRAAAAKIFNAVDGYGIARVDFFVTDEGEVIFNEINTMPGFTSISMYQILWEEAGLSAKELVGELLRLAFKRQGI